MFSPTHSQPRRAARAFTLMEILVALAILGLLVGIAVTNIDRTLGTSSEAVAKLFVQDGIKIPLTTYRMAMGSYPSTSDGLNALVTAPANNADSWRGPYVADGKLPLDPWNQPYQYCFPGVHNKDSYDVWSKGAPAHPADIGNW